MRLHTDTPCILTFLAGGSWRAPRRRKHRDHDTPDLVHTRPWLSSQRDASR